LEGVEGGEWRVESGRWTVDSGDLEVLKGMDGIYADI
jgi:hypothetical protein